MEIPESSDQLLLNVAIHYGPLNDIWLMQTSWEILEPFNENPLPMETQQLLFISGILQVHLILQTSKFQWLAMKEQKYYTSRFIEASCEYFIFKLEDQHVYLSFCFYFAVPFEDKILAASDQRGGRGAEREILV